jgi:hypothetical protein
MPLKNHIFHTLLHNRLNAIDRFRKLPLEIQEKQLFSIVLKAKYTVWGKRFDYSNIKTITDFQKKVPIHKYEQYYEWIDRLRKGEKDVLWPGYVRWFAKSSGTTNDKSKFIPVTKVSLHACHYRGGTDSLLLYTSNYPKSKVLYGKTITLGGSHQLDKFDNGIRAGDLSAIMLQNIPLWADIFRTPPKEIALISKWEEKLQLLSNHVIKENITAFAGVPSWNLVLMRHILKVTGKKNLLEVWPNLELFLHGGVNFSPYKEQYHTIIPSNAMHYMETFNASEGFFAIQDDPNDPSMLLMLDYGIFYEFIRMDEYREENYSAISLSEVKSGVNYAMVISTNGGLWRYVIGDTVMFTSLNPYKIVITGRTKHYINAFGEELIIENAENALSEACKQTGAIINEYTAAPVFMDNNAKGKHEWLIEFEKAPIDIFLFATKLDESLKRLNSDYEAKRYNDITLTLPEIKSLPKGSFYKWFTINEKLGGQNKIPRLSNDRKYVEQLLSICND